MKTGFRVTKEQALWSGLILFALLLRLLHLGHRALSHDESLHALFSWYLRESFTYRHDPMMHGPLQFFLNGAVYLLLPVNDFTSRLIPALWGTGCVAILYLFRPWLGRAGAFCAALLLTLEPAHLTYSRYLRNDIAVSFFTLLMVWAILKYRRTRNPRSLLWLTLGLALHFLSKETSYIHGFTLGLICLATAMAETLNGTTRERWKALFVHPLTHCALLQLFMALPFACALIHAMLGWDPLDHQTVQGQSRTFAAAALLLAAGGIPGILLFQRQGLLKTFLHCMGLFWGLQVLFYSTFFTNVRPGLASGLAGGLGYWLAQHDVQRGNDDPFFYLTLLLLYSPLFLWGAAKAFGRLRDPVVRLMLPWFGLHLLIYSRAGERMPWLVLHISLPLILLTAMALPDALRSTRPLVYRLVIVLGCLQLIANSQRLQGRLSEGPWEPMFYAHSGAGVKTSVLLTEQHFARNPEGVIAVDNAYAWPMVWYFRGLPVHYLDLSDTPLPDNAVVLLAPPRTGERLAQEGWTKRLRVDMTTWPRPHYHRFSRKNLRRLIREPSLRRKLLRYVLFRDQPDWGETDPPVPNRFQLLTRTKP